MTPTVLMILSAADSVQLADGSRHSTGYWAEEVVTPWQVMTAAGVRVRIATPGGRRPVADPLSLDPALHNGDTAKVEALRAALATIPDLERPESLSSIDDKAAQDIAALFFPGGHGPLEDLWRDEDVGRLLRLFHGAGKPVAALCHGPAALMAAQDERGRALYGGYRATSFSDAEEAQTELAGRLAFTVESALRHSGMSMEPGPAWGDTVVVDRDLLTGQNPASAAHLAEALVAAIRSG